MKKSASFWLFLAAAGLFLLQWFPWTGVFLMLVGTGFINAWLIYLLLVTLFIESVIGRLPRVAVIVPVAFICAYYWGYREQYRLLAEETPKLKTVNIGKVLNFDPDTQSLVFDDAGAGQAIYFVAHFRVPVAYFGEKSVRMAPASECPTIESFHNGAFAWVETAAKQYPYARFSDQTAPCILWRWEKPAKAAVHVRYADYATSTLQWFGIREPSTDVVVNGNVVGAFRKIVVRRISPYLQFVGCGLIDQPPAWKCTTSYFSERDEIILPDPPNGAERQEFYERVSLLLGIPKYTDDDIRQFSGYRENDPIIALAKSPVPRR